MSLIDSSQWDTIKLILINNITIGVIDNVCVINTSCDTSEIGVSYSSVWDNLIIHHNISRITGSNTNTFKFIKSSCASYWNNWRGCSSISCGKISWSYSWSDISQSYNVCIGIHSMVSLANFQNITTSDYIDWRCRNHSTSIRIKVEDCRDTRSIYIIKNLSSTCTKCSLNIRNCQFIITMNGWNRNLDSFTKSRTDCYWCENITNLISKTTSVDGCSNSHSTLNVNISCGVNTMTTQWGHSHTSKGEMTRRRCITNSSVHDIKSHLSGWTTITNELTSSSSQSLGDSHTWFKTTLSCCSSKSNSDCLVKWLNSIIWNNF